MGTYEKIISDSFNLIDSSIIDDCEAIFLIPILAPEDIKNKLKKSSSFMIYPALHLLKETDKKFSGKIIELKDSANNIEKNFQENYKNLIIYIDDFVGTGDTFDSFFKKESQHLQKLQQKETIALFLVGQEIGISSIEKLGIKVCCAKHRKKGISENPNIPNVVYAQQIMAELEKKISVPPEYKFGYGNSEALGSGPIKTIYDSDGI